MVGCVLGSSVGTTFGEVLGVDVGGWLGCLVGNRLGAVDGGLLGCLVGVWVGNAVGCSVGALWILNSVPSEANVVIVSPHADALSTDARTKICNPAGRPASIARVITARYGALTSLSTNVDTSRFM